jgi:carboxylesterase type B
MRQLLLISLLVAATFCLPEDQAQTEGGLVRGLVSDGYRAFKGIPFMAPPVGDLRWAAPQPKAPWSPAVLDASQYSAGCPQQCQLPTLICPDRTDEDCIYLNIFTPRVSQMTSKLPVMVFFPGGHFDQGTATTDLYNGGYMVNRSNVILVTTNYRLGVLGWIATGTMKGNYGFQDQLAALQWVQRNIANFGGDPTQVTIFGESAGATSIAAHLMSVKSTGLFSRAIIESFPATLPMKTWEDARKIGRLFLGNLSCSDGDMGCLRSKSVNEILVAQNKVANHLPILHPLQLFLPWTPVINGIEFSDDMWTAVSSGSFNKVPLLIGTVSEEALMFVYLAAPDMKINDAEYIAALGYLFTSDAAKVLIEYPPTPIVGDKRPALGALGTDYIFTCANRYWTGLITANNVPTWIYQFTHPSSVDFWTPTYPFCVGHVCHGVELPFLFNTLQLFNMQPTPQEVQMSNSMIDYWTNFAKTGNPNKPAPVQYWPQFDYTNFNSLNINTPISVVQGLKKNKCDFWDSIGYNDGTK